MNEQGTPEWFAERCGCATASEFSSVLAKGQGKTRSAYLRRVVAERLTGKPVETYKNAHMERGNELELFARAKYETLRGVFVDEVGFIRHGEIMAGCSPDGLVGDDGGLEIKSVIPTVQVETILSGLYPSEHKPQIQGALWITGRKWWDFCSYSPDMPEGMDVYVFRVERDESYIQALEIEVINFLADVDLTIQKLLGLCKDPQA